MKVFILLMLLVGCTQPEYTFMNYTPEELKSDAAKRGLEHFKNITTTEITFTKETRALLAFKLRELGIPSWPGEDNNVTIIESIHDNGTMSFNCGGCHSGAVGTRFVGGLPNKHFDTPAAALLNQIIITASQVQDSPEQKASADYLAAVLTKIGKDNSHTIGATVGNWIVYSTVALLSDRGVSLDDWDLKSKDLVRMLEIADGVYPVHHARPWWLARYSGTHFWMANTGAELDSGSATLAVALGTPNFGNPNMLPWKERLKISRDQQVYMSEIQSPKWERDIDEELVGVGHKIYQKSCASCHGKMNPTPEKKYQYVPGTVDRYIAQKHTKTDLAYWTLNSKLDFIQDKLVLNKEYIAAGGSLLYPKSNDKPYIDTPPLVGVWASAPYLHNGSVPTLEDLLKPDLARPARWELDKDQQAYDYDKVGVVYKLAAEDLQNPYIYDTVSRDPRSGMSNKGHNFGTDLPPQHKTALIEFLKTLGTDNVLTPKGTE